MESTPLPRPLPIAQAELLQVQAGQVFTPRTPISNRELFSGRWAEINQLVDAANEIGLHVVLYGERGVGKTSLANVIPIVLSAFDSTATPTRQQPRISVSGNANTSDSFSSVWKKLFNEIAWQQDTPTIGFKPKPGVQIVNLLDAYGLANVDIGVEEVRRLLSTMPGSVFVIDEFDRLPKKVAAQFTDLIKVLADKAIDTTIMIVGVAETVDGLVRDHASIPRALIQIPLRPMSVKDLLSILTKAEERLGIVFERSAAERIAILSQGRPHYTHLVGLLAVRASLQRYSGVVTMSDVTTAFERAVKAADHTISKLYDDATYSGHTDALWKPVLLACAIAAARESDPMGYFSPSAVVEPLSEILQGRDVQISTFNGHLAEYCEDKRGILQRTGRPRAYRYRFRDPLISPYVLMRGLAEKMISPESLSALMSPPSNTVFSTGSPPPPMPPRNFNA